MIMILHLLYLFGLGASVGWFIELLFRRMVSQHRWVNPGFLNGPYLPLYGVTTVLLYLIRDLGLGFGYTLVLYIVVPTLIEYLTGLFFVKVYSIRLWDYSDRRFNIQGIICPLFTLFWALLGVLFGLVVYPVLEERLQALSAHLEYSFFVGLFYGVLLVDLIISFDVAEQIRRRIRETERELQVNFERLKLEVRSWSKQNTARRLHMRFLSPFSGSGGRGLKTTIEAELRRFKEELPDPKSILRVSRILKKRVEKDDE